MQRFFIALAFLTGFLNSVKAQQNIFNVPTSELTRRHQFIIQQQINVSGQEVQSNTTFSYGIGRNLELGFNLFNVKGHTRPLGLESNSDPQKEPLSPFVLLNAQKGFYLTEWLSLGVGGQYGFHFPENNDVRVGAYAYGNLITELLKLNTRLITGLYHADRTLFGPGYRNDFFLRPPGLGIQLGFEQPLFHNKLLLVADYMGGTHSYGAATAGLDFRIQKKLELAVGYQFPNPYSAASEGLIFQFTLLP